MNKLQTSVLLMAAILLTGVLATMGTYQTASAKDTECKVDADKNTCVIVVKRGDFEVDKLLMDINVNSGNDVNVTGLEDQINQLEDTVEDLQSQVSDLQNSSVTSLEISEGSGNGNDSENN